MDMRTLVWVGTVALLGGCAEYQIKQDIQQERGRIEVASLQQQRQQLHERADSLEDCAKVPPGAGCDRSEAGLRRQMGELRRAAQVAILKQHKQVLQAQVAKLQAVTEGFEQCMQACMQPVAATQVQVPDQNQNGPSGAAPPQPGPGPAACRAQCKIDDFSALEKETRDLMRKLAAGESAPAEEASGAGPSCRDWMRQAHETNVYIFDGRTRAVQQGVGVQYDTRPVTLCVDNPNYAMTYQVTTSAAALPAIDTSNGFADLLLKDASGGKGGGKTGGAASDGRCVRWLAAAIEARGTKEAPAQAAQLKVLLANNTALLTLSGFVVEGTLGKGEAKLAGALGMAGTPVERVTAVAKLLATDVDLFRKVLGQLIEQGSAEAKTALELLPLVPTCKEDKPAVDPLAASRAAVAQAAPAFDVLRVGLGADYVSRARFLELYRGVDAHRAALQAAYQALSASKEEADKALADAAGRMAKTLVRLAGHLDSYAQTPLLFVVRPEREKETTLTVSGSRLKLRSDYDRGADAIYAPGEYQTVTTATVQVRTLLYVRASLGLVWSSLQSPTYAVAQSPTDAQSQVLVANEATEIVPLLILSHYWSGVDLREMQPWDKRRPGWWKNMFPTFAVGIPLSKSPLQNFFIGAQWQPVPGLSVIGGANLGKVNVLRDGYSVGGVVPTGFKAVDAVESDYRVGGFVGVAVMDSLFVKLILALTGVK